MEQTKRCENENCDRREACHLRCSACGVAFYCGKQCQRSDWPRHKLLCRRKIPDGASSIAPLHLRIVTLADVEDNLLIFDEMASLLKAPALSDDEKRRFYGRDHPMPLRHNHVHVAPSTRHGNGLFATSALPGNTVVTYYPCDVIYHDECLYMKAPDAGEWETHKEEWVRDYGFQVLADKMIVANPTALSNSLLLGHMVNDACDYAAVFGQPPVSAEALVDLDRFGELYCQYYASLRGRVNCFYERDARRLVVSVVTSRPIDAGEELLTTYGLINWLAVVYGRQYQTDYPFMPRHCETLEAALARLVVACRAGLVKKPDTITYDEMRPFIVI